MRLKSAIKGEISSEISPLGKLQIGNSKNYNPRSRTIDIETSEGGISILYSGVVIPSLGDGIRPSNIEDGTPLVFGFIGGTRDIPVVLSFLTGTGLSPASAKNISTIGSVSRGYLKSHL